MIAMRERLEHAVDPEDILALALADAVGALDPDSVAIKARVAVYRRTCARKCVTSPGASVEIALPDRRDAIPRGS